MFGGRANVFWDKDCHANKLSACKQIKVYVLFRNGELVAGRRQLVVQGAWSPVSSF